MSAERVHQLDQGHPSPKSEESGHDSGQSVHVEFLGDDQAVTSQKSVLPRCGSLREQFAALLKAHFATTMEAQAAAGEI